jgi:DNA-binding NtrC family response regulator
VRTQTNILVVDDDRAMVEFLVEGLASADRDIRAVTQPDAALAEVATADVVITDLRMPGIDGLELCRQIVSLVDRDVPVIVLTAFGDYDTAIAAMRAGAYDFLAKPVKLDVLELALARAVEHGRLRRDVKRLTATISSGHGLDKLIGSSPVMEHVYSLIRRVADSESSVLVTGESGTGKELVARALHHAGPRASAPFIPINCAAMPETLLESELFGHERGAFTDARSARSGLFVDATGGTLFLDEIGELPLALQPKLLRALQERRVRPLGGRREVPFDVRLVAATNRDLEAAVDEGTFRADLFFRLNVIEVDLPPLRARGNDVLALASHFLAEFEARARKGIVGLSAATAKHLLDYDWPGNVRELHNVIERAVALAGHDHLTPDDLPERVKRTPRAKGSPFLTQGELVTLEELERRYIQHVLEATGGSRTSAARVLGLDRTTLWRRLDRGRPLRSVDRPPGGSQSEALRAVDRPPGGSQSEALRAVDRPPGGSQSADPSRGR